MASPTYITNGGLVAAIGTTVGLTYMGSISANDMLIAQVLAGTLGTWSTPAGWVKIGEIQYSGSDSLTFAVFRKRANGSESGVENFTHSVSDTLSGIISSYSGCLTTGDPIEDPAFLSGRTATETAFYNFDAFTTAGIERLGIICLGVSNDQTSNPPTSWTEEFDITDVTGTDSAHSVKTLEVATAQTIAAGTGVLSRNNSYGNCVFALIPEGEASNELSGTISCGTTLSGDIKASGKLSGVINCSSSLSGDIKGGGKLSGTINCSTLLTGNLTSGATLSGTINCGTTLSGNLKASGKLSGIIDCSTDVLGNLKASGKLTGIIDCSTVLSGDIKGGGNVSGIIDCSTVLSGILKASGKLSGTINCSTVLSGNLVSGAGITLDNIIFPSKMTKEITFSSKMTKEIIFPSKMTKEIIFPSNIGEEIEH